MPIRKMVILEMVIEIVVIYDGLFLNYRRGKKVSISEVNPALTIFQRSEMNRLNSIHGLTFKTLT